MSKCINTESTKEVKGLLKKYSKNITVDTQYLRGEFKITSYRKYYFCEEVDVEFYGQIYVKIGSKKDWFSSDEMKFVKNLSKIKLNRFLRRTLFNEVNRRCSYFNVTLHHYGNIKKIIWK